jgi:multidrug transporter EmrE-like cation transporter
MPWLILVAAGLLEIVWATALKQSDGFSGYGRASSASAVRH